MGYITTLEKAGAKVIASKFLGSYQGTWGAICDYKGQRVMAVGSFGSCSYCDAFEAEFETYSSSDEVRMDKETGKYYRGWFMDEDSEITKEQYDAGIAALDKRYCEFGETYLRNPETKESIQKRIDYYNSLSDDDYFDYEERELYDWAIKFFDK